MQDMNRRAALGLLFGGAVAVAGVAMLPSGAEAVTLPKLDGLPEGDELVHDSQYIVFGHRRRRRRRRHCWYRRGRRVCRW